MRRKQRRRADERPRGLEGLSAVERDKEGVVFDSVERAIEDVRAGKPVVVVDGEDRENEGDLIFAAEFASPELLAFMVRHCSGFVCVALPEAEADRLGLPPMCHVNQNRSQVAYAVTTDASDGVTTGISAADRAHTIRLLSQPTTVAGDLHRPGHVVPLRAEDGGVLRRAGHTEAALDLAVLAGAQPAGVLCAIVSERDPVTMADARESHEFAGTHGLTIISIADLIEYRRRTARVIERVTVARVPVPAGKFTAVGYEIPFDDREHLALVHGDVGDGEDVLVAVHAECVTGDAFGSLRCDCRPQLQASLQAAVEHGRGVVLYIRGHQGISTGLLGTLQAYERQDLRLRLTGRQVAGADESASHDLGGLKRRVEGHAGTPGAVVIPVDSRDLAGAGQILTELGVRTVLPRSLSASERGVLQRHGLSIRDTSSAAPTGRIGTIASRVS